MPEIQLYCARCGGSRGYEIPDGVSKLTICSDCGFDQWQSLPGDLAMVPVARHDVARPQPGVAMQEVWKLVAAGLAAAVGLLSEALISGTPITGALVVKILVGTVVVRLAGWVVGKYGPQPTAS